MSDIGIRLDGLLLGMFMVAGVILFAAISVVSIIRTLLAQPGGKRSWKIAARSAVFAFCHVIGLMILAVYLDEYGAPLAGPDWIDWLSVPWSGFILVGVFLLVRSRTRTAV